MSPWFWLGCNFIFLITLSYYSAIEMACISFNRVRLNYYLSVGNKRAKWLDELLQEPQKLFGTTLIGVNIFLVLGSECARQFFVSIGYPPDWSALPQILIVILFGELAPMFAARQYPEQVTLVGIPLLYFSQKLLTPVFMVTKGISRAFSFLFGGGKEMGEALMPKEELQKLLEDQKAEGFTGDGKDRMARVVSNIFSLETKKLVDVMLPLAKLNMVGAKATVKELKRVVQSGQSFYPLVKEKGGIIVGVVYPRDLLKQPENRRVREYAKAPWCIQETMGLFDLLKQFRNNGESFALVIDLEGKPCGYLTLDRLLHALFGEWEVDDSTPSDDCYVDRTFSSSVLLEEVENLVGVSFGEKRTLTLKELCLEFLGEQPEEGMQFSYNHVLFEVDKIAVFEVAKVRVQTKL